MRSKFNLHAAAVDMWYYMINDFYEHCYSEAKVNDVLAEFVRATEGRATR